jgi:hypothetical protein
MLALFAVASVIAFVFLLRWERRRFIAMDKGKAWLLVRLVTTPIAVVTAALCIIPARGTSGMEGLAVFYILLMLAGPILWFGVHWMAGRCVRPQLSFVESAQIAGSPIALGLALAYLAHALQSMAWSFLRAIGMA